MNLFVTIGRWMFWIDAGSAARSIQSSKLTGADRQFLLRGPGNVHRPVGLCIDVDQRRLYWSDLGFGTILTSDYDGNNIIRFRVEPNYANRLIGLSVGTVSDLLNYSKVVYIATLIK